MTGVCGGGRDLGALFELHAQIMLANVGEVEDDSEEVDDEGEPEGGRVAPLVDGHATKDDAEPHADVPTGEDGGVGSASLIVGRKVDEHGLESRPDVSVAKSDDDGCSVEAYGVLEESEEEVAKDTDEDAVVDILHHPTLAQGTCSHKTREDKSTAQDGKPSSRTCAHAKPLLAVDGEVGGKDSVGEAYGDHDETLAPAFYEKEAVERKG